MTDAPRADDDPASPLGEPYAMYTDLAPWWPLLSPPQDYVDEAALIEGLLRTGLGERQDGEFAARRPVLLELGSGGGHNAVHLGGSFELVLVDASPEMLDVSRALNPGAEHRLGDMREFRLGRGVDAVLVHDAIDYMTTLEDLSAVFATARAHLNEGGVAIFMPDDTLDSYADSTEHGGSDGADGSGIRYLAWSWDPNPDDTWVQTEYSYLIRAADGTVRSVSETHQFGVFSVQTWLDLLAQNGFSATAIDITSGEDSDEAQLRTLFLAHVDPAAAHAATASGSV